MYICNFIVPCAGHLYPIFCALPNKSQAKKSACSGVFSLELLVLALVALFLPARTWLCFFFLERFLQLLYTSHFSRLPQDFPLTQALFGFRGCNTESPCSHPFPPDVLCLRRGAGEVGMLQRGWYSSLAYAPGEMLLRGKRKRRGAKG